MEVSSSKEKILKKIRQALVNPVPVPFGHSEGSMNLFPVTGKEAAVEFAENFTSLQGRFSFCLDSAELNTRLEELIIARKLGAIFCNDPKLLDALKHLDQRIFNQKSLADSDAAITGCEYLIARTGSIMMSSGEKSGRSVSVYTPVHICIAYTRQLVFDIKDALQLMKDRYPSNLPSFITVATGPSRTADIEKTLVTGVHGPKEVYVFLLEE